MQPLSLFPDAPQMGLQRIQFEFYIKYKGECMSCSMNTTTTLAGIEDMLKFKLKAPIKVIVT